MLAVRFGLFLLYALVLLPAGRGQERAGFDPATVTIAPTRTSIYVGSVSLRMPPFERRGETYASTYRARVVPYFFASERGTLVIDLPDEQLARLGAGETIEFTGRAENTQGEAREISGRAVPGDAQSGTIKVRVRVSPKIELIFNTTYRFGA